MTPLNNIMNNAKLIYNTLKDAGPNLNET